MRGATRRRIDLRGRGDEPRGPGGDRSHDLKLRPAWVARRATLKAQVKSKGPAGGAHTMHGVIRLRMNVGDLGRMRFGYSPLAEVAQSIYMLSERRVREFCRPWFDAVRARLNLVDMRLLCAVIPPGRLIADWFFDSGVRRSTTIQDQLKVLAEMGRERLSQGITSVWGGSEMSLAARELIASGESGPSRLAEAIEQYWEVAISPYWTEMRAVLDDDVAYRAGNIVNGGGELLFADLHPDVTLQGDHVLIAKTTNFERALEGHGLTLVPTVFAWPHCVVTLNNRGPVSLSYAARGVGRLWGNRESILSRLDVLGDLLGRSRAAIIVDLAVPRSTTELAVRLGVSPPSVSQHLAILRRGGLVTSWRSGRRVLYQRTALAVSIVAEDADASAS